MGLPYYDAFDMIMQPTLNPFPNVSESDIRQAMEGHKLNHPQAKAILSALGTKGFSLIQGSVWYLCKLRTNLTFDLVFLALLVQAKPQPFAGLSGPSCRIAALHQL